MKKIYIILILSLINISNVFSDNGNGVSLQDKSGNAITSSNPLQVHCVSGCGGSASGSQGQFQYNNSGSFAGGNIYQSGNNIGIGSTTPSQALDVVGSVRASSSLISGTGNAIIYGDANSNIGIGSASPGSAFDVPGISRAQSFQQITSSTNSFNGNLGVGVSSPGMKLDVQGTTRSTTFATNVGIGTSTALAATSCLCKQFSGGLCIVPGTCT